MKKIYLILALFLGFAFGLNAQSIKVTYRLTETEVKKNNDTIVVDILTEDEYGELNPRRDYFDIENLTDNDLNIKVRVNAISLSSQSTLGFCVGTTCLSAGEISSTQQIVAKEILDEFDLQYTLANNNQSWAKVDIIDADQTEETILMTFKVNYKDPDDVSITSNAAKSVALGMDVYPNPVQNVATIKYSLPKEYTNGQIVVRNMVGSVVKTENINNGQGKVQFSTSNMTNGVYFYSIIGNGRTLSTKKMIVKH